jgi:predicted phage tail protein
MNSTIKSVRRPTITLALPKNVPALISFAQGIVNRMTGNPSFLSPTPALASVSTAINELQAAETAALARTKGAAAVRNEKRTALVGAIQQLRGYIQSIADADPTKAASIIESAGVAVRKTPTHTARAFAAKPGPVSGVAKVTAAAASRRASYEWQYSADGGKTWVTAPATLQAKTTVAGLVPGSTVQFKYRAVTKTGEGDWSQPLSLLVH